MTLKTLLNLSWFIILFSTYFAKYLFPERIFLMALVNPKTYSNILSWKFKIIELLCYTTQKRLSLHCPTPNWHELRKQEKCLSLAPPRSKFYKTQWAWQSVKSTWLLSIFTSKKVLKFLIKIQLTKSDPKRTRGGKCPPSCQLGLRACMKVSK